MNSELSSIFEAAKETHSSLSHTHTHTHRVTNTYFPTEGERLTQYLLFRSLRSAQAHERRWIAAGRHGNQRGPFSITVAQGGKKKKTGVS